MIKKLLLFTIQRFHISFFIMAFAISFFSPLHIALAAQQSSVQKTTKTSKKTATPNKIKKVSTPNKVSQDALEKKFSSLVKDTKSNALRQSWIQIESQFDSLTTSDRAMFYSARCREELSVRSFSTSDYKLAVKKFEQMSMTFPKSKLAPEALLRAATIASQRLKDPNITNRIIKKLSTSYPKSLEKDKAQILIKKSTARTNRPQQRKDPKNGLAEQLGLTANTVMIDPGHGGKDPGAKGNGITEKELTLKTALLLEKELKKLGFSVLFTHRKDNYIALNERIEIANAKNVDIFISIHANATTDAATNGLETYYLDAASNSAAAKVAARENSVSVAQVSDLQFILTDLMLTSKTQESKNLANCVHSTILDQVRTPNKKHIFDHGVRTAPFYVLMGAKMPAILVEIGYLTNKTEAASLKNSTYIAMVARSIAVGVSKYKASIAQQLE